MYDLNTFETVRFSSGNAFITLSINSIIFNREVVNGLGRPKFVKLLMNEKEKCIAIKATPGFDDDKIEFVKDNDSINVHWNNREFVRKLKSWANASEKSLLRIHGEYIARENAFVFDFKKTY